MMQSTFALSVPHTSSTRSSNRVAWVDVIAGISAVNIWGRLGWRDTKRRYRRTVFGPFWTTVSLAFFVITLGLVWSNLWNKDPKVYLPFLVSGMLCWTFLLGVCTEASNSFCMYEKLIKQLRISYTLLACAVVWRNVIVLFHNAIIYLPICIYARILPTWATLLVIPGFALVSLNAVWIVLILGSAGARYRDLPQVIGNLLQISMFLTPIFWSPDQLTGRTAILVQFNPLYHFITIVREPLLGQPPALLHWLVVAFITVIGWALTIQMLTRFRHRVVYWL
jgi:ABC-type polysaccharide/polyol phosphate export permease